MDFLNLNTAKGLNKTFIFPAIAGLIFLFFSLEPPALIFGIIIQIIVIILFISGASTSDFSKQKTYGIISMVLEFVLVVTGLILSFTEGADPTGLGAGLFVALFGIIKFATVKE
ncbi:MAG: hypothetical protein GKR88_12975 [Flavobacteriaceae bacterium]|nr:MAG: hypothetical protein GKR88_12975 [Flavobacteriaceae bacterium]